MAATITPGGGGGGGGGPLLLVLIVFLLCATCKGGSSVFKAPTTYEDQPKYQNGWTSVTMDGRKRPIRSAQVSVIQGGSVIPLPMQDVTDDELTNGSGMPSEEVFDQGHHQEKQEFEPSRSKRKVVSHGAHYILRSRSGNSPWSPSSYDGQSTYRVSVHSNPYSSPRYTSSSRNRGRRLRRLALAPVTEKRSALPLSTRDVLENEVNDVSERPLQDILKHEKQESKLKRSKRKVISRGGHYIIRSSSGNSPWSSSSYDSQSTYRGSSQSSTYMSPRSREYGWNPRGRIGDSGLRTTTFGEILPRRPDRRSLRKKLPRTFKGEIAQYAMLHGAAKAALHYEHRVGRRLRERVVRKFVQRYKERVKKKKKTKP